MRLTFSALNILSRHFQVVMGVKIYQKLCTIGKVQTQPKCCVSRDAAPIVNDLAMRFGEIPMALASWLCDRPYSVRNSSFSISPGGPPQIIPCHGFLLLVIIQDQQRGGSPFIHFEDNPPLIIDFRIE